MNISYLYMYDRNSQQISRYKNLLKITIYLLGVIINSYCKVFYKKRAIIYIFNSCSDFWFKCYQAKDFLESHANGNSEINQR